MYSVKVRGRGLLGLAPAVLVDVLAVDPAAAVGGQGPVIAAGGVIAADVLAVGQGEAQIQGVAGGQEVIGQALSGVGLAADGVHPAGALGIIELAQAVGVVLAGEVQAVPEDFGPEVFRSICETAASFAIPASIKARVASTVSFHECCVRTEISNWASNINKV